LPLHHQENNPDYRHSGEKTTHQNRPKTDFILFLWNFIQKTMPALIEPPIETLVVIKSRSIWLIRLIQTGDRSLVGAPLIPEPSQIMVAFGPHVFFTARIFNNLKEKSIQSLWFGLNPNHNLFTASSGEGFRILDITPQNDFGSLDTPVHQADSDMPSRRGEFVARPDSAHGLGQLAG
jgi:hypothetical protein